MTRKMIPTQIGLKIRSAIRIVTKTLRNARKASQTFPKVSPMFQPSLVIVR